MNKIGHKIIRLERVDSTNNYIANLLKEDKMVHGTAILAEEQTNGRGQRGTTWQDTPGMNLMVSFYVEFDELLIEQQVAIHHWIATSVWKTLKSYGIESSIKWPNDILTKNGKLAGILIENTIGGKYIKHSIIGIGINVNQTDFNGISATSVALELGRMVPKDELLMLLIKELNATKDLLQLKQFDLLKKEYLSHLWRLNEAVKFVRNEQEEDGVIVGTNEFGLLEVQTQHGIEVFDIKEVKFITSEL